MGTSWFIFGDKKSLRLSISEEGHLSFNGECNHDTAFCWIGDRKNTPEKTVQRIEQAKCSWYLNPPSKEWNDDILNMDKKILKDQLNKPLKKPWGFISFWENNAYSEKDEISFNVVAPDSFFLQYKYLLEHTLSSDNFTYQFMFDFGGFRTNENPVSKKFKMEHASPEEFLNGRPCIIKSISLSIESQRKNQTPA